jgi:hypothetical protein
MKYSQLPHHSLSVVLPTIQLSHLKHSNPSLSTNITGGQPVQLSGTISDGTFAVVISGLKTFPIPVINNQFIFPTEADIKGQVISFLYVQLIERSTLFSLRTGLFQTIASLQDQQ